MIEELNIYIIDDHEYFAKGVIASFLDSNEKMFVKGFSKNGFSCLNQLSQLEIDVVLLDILMPEFDGISCCREIKQLYPRIKVIALTSVTDSKLLLKIWLEKVDGILSKSCSFEELIRSIRVVHANRKVIGSGFLCFFEELEEENGSTPKLTKAEIKVLTLLSCGFSRKEVAEQINRTPKLVDFHCLNIFKKFKSNKINEIIAEAKRLSIVK